MDEMKLNLSTKLMRGLVAKLIKKAIYNKFGCEVNIELNYFAVEYKDGRANLKTDIYADIGKDELGKILNSIGL